MLLIIISTILGIYLTFFPWDMVLYCLLQGQNYTKAKHIPKDCIIKFFFFFFFERLYNVCFY